MVLTDWILEHDNKYIVDVTRRGVVIDGYIMPDRREQHSILARDLERANVVAGYHFLFSHIHSVRPDD